MYYMYIHVQCTMYNVHVHYMYNVCSQQIPGKITQLIIYLHVPISICSSSRKCQLLEYEIIVATTLKHTYVHVYGICSTSYTYMLYTTFFSGPSINFVMIIGFVCPTTDFTLMFFMCC